MQTAKLMVAMMVGVVVVLASTVTAQPVVYVRGNIYTMEAAPGGRPRAEAMVVDEGKVVGIGSEAEARAVGVARGGAKVKVVDLEGRTVLPGLIDAHGHMAGLGSFGTGVLDFGRARSFEEVVNKVAEAAREKSKGKVEQRVGTDGNAVRGDGGEEEAAPGSQPGAQPRIQVTPPGAGARGADGRGEDWILGGRWDHESWSSKELPTHQDLSKAVPDRPVWLRRVDGHAGLANKKAMEVAGITRDTPNPEGGEIIKDGKGEPTGVLIDNAMSLITRRMPASAGGGTTEEVLLKAQEMCLAAGLTSVHDAGCVPAQLGVYRELAESGKLKIRIYAMVAGYWAARWFDEHEPEIGIGAARGEATGGKLTIRAAKLYMDGAMGSRGAWLIEPYADRPKDAEGKPYTGLAVGRTDEVEAISRHAAARGYQVCTHAIGDRGNREVLNAYERALSGAVDRRFRIEHAQLLSFEDVPRFAKLGVIASMQPTHCTSDMRWVDERVGAERGKGAYVWGSLLRSGVRIAGGSDFPVESHNPFLGFYAAVTRCDESGTPAGGWHPSEKMTREEALRAFTIDAAYAAFEEGERGSLKVGKWADFVVIDRDVMVCPEREILGTRVLRTVVSGEEVFWDGAGGEGPG
jgi:predicted amidohydrolase YtcJ